MIGLVVLAMWTAPDVKRVNFTDLDFHVNASDRLYFKNLRQFYYSVSQTETNQFERFTLKTSEEGAEVVQFEILNNWRIDEAYIRLASVEKVQSPIISYHYGLRKNWELTTLNAEDHLIMAGELFEVLQADTALVTLSYGSVSEPIWQENESRAAALTLLKDYFRLIGGLR
jgi:hypothetical protein